MITIRAALSRKQKEDQKEGTRYGYFRGYPGLWLPRLMTSAGMIIAILSFLFILVTIIRHFAMNIAVGYSSTIAAILLMGGLTIMSVGIVGLYVGNIFMEVKHRPLYIVRTALNDHTKEKENP